MISNGYLLVKYVFATKMKTFFFPFLVYSCLFMAQRRLPHISILNGKLYDEVTGENSLQALLIKLLCNETFN